MNNSLSKEDIENFNDKERRELLADNPLVSALFFYERTEYFLDKILKIKFGVVDFWRRYEWQHRGNPHIHMLLWLNKAPDVSSISQMAEEERKDVVRYYENLISSMNPGLNQPPAIIHPCGKHLHEVENRVADLAKLVNKVQRHTKCSANYSLRKNKKTGAIECRYHFPFQLCNESQLVQNDKGQIELITKQNDPLVNKFNPWVLQLWRANIDITPVLSKDAFLVYIAKYASKADLQSSKVISMMPEILLDIDKTIQVLRQKKMSEYNATVEMIEQGIHNYNSWNQHLSESKRKKDEQTNRLAKEIDIMKSKCYMLEAEENILKNEISVIKSHLSKTMSNAPDEKELSELIKSMTDLKIGLDMKRKDLKQQLEQYKKGIEFYKTYLLCNAICVSKDTVIITTNLSAKSESEVTDYIKFTTKDNAKSFQYVEMQPSLEAEQELVKKFQETNDIQSLVFYFLKTVRDRKNKSILKEKN